MYLIHVCARCVRNPPNDPCSPHAAQLGHHSPTNGWGVYMRWSPRLTQCTTSYFCWVVLSYRCSWDTAHTASAGSIADMHEASSHPAVVQHTFRNIFGQCLPPAVTPPPRTLSLRLFFYELRCSNCQVHHISASHECFGFQPIGTHKCRSIAIPAYWYSQTSILRYTSGRSSLPEQTYYSVAIIAVWPTPF